MVCFLLHPASYLTNLRGSGCLCGQFLGLASLRAAAFLGAVCFSPSPPQMGSTDLHKGLHSSALAGTSEGCLSQLSGNVSQPQFMQI